MLVADTNFSHFSLSLAKSNDSDFLNLGFASKSLYQLESKYEVSMNKTWLPELELLLQWKHSLSRNFYFLHQSVSYSSDHYYHVNKDINLWIQISSNLIFW